MTDDQKIELRIRQYFDHYLETIRPKLVDEHFNSCSHGKTMNKIMYIGIGIIIALSPAFGNGIIDLIAKLKGV